jgi:hypothetical protein
MHWKVRILLVMIGLPVQILVQACHVSFTASNSGCLHFFSDDSCAGCRYKTDDACFWEQWECAAVAHYSFLHHMRAGSLAAYAFNNWDLCYPDYHRWSINFFLFNSSDLLGDLISNEIDDEVLKSKRAP